MGRRDLRSAGHHADPDVDLHDAAPPASTCAHAVCSTGDKLTSACDPCAAKVCAADAYCCNNSWDGTCVQEVASVCGQTCK